jgi:TolA-binding protein
LLVVASALLLQGCSVYYNTYFNAEKAHGQALRLREKRLENNPEDTVVVSSEEKAKLQRTIAKSSKVLELWPDNKKYAPKAVFLIADSYLLMEEYDLAVPKYAEFIRFYPNDPKVPLARVRMAKAMYRDRQALNARDVLAQVMAANPQGEVRREALLLSAQMQVDENSPAEGLAVYERLLSEGAFTTPESRAEAHWQAAQLALKLKRWEAVRAHALTPEISTLPVRTQYRNRKLGIEALYQLGRFDQGIAEAQDMSKDKKFRTVRADLVLLQARGRDGKGQWKDAERQYRLAARMSESRGAVASEAFYRIGDHFWTKQENEDSARAYFDSAGASGAGFEFGSLGQARGAALARVLELRKPDTTNADSARPHYRDFALAEVFYFELDRPDSARAHLDAIAIAADTVEDSVYTRRGLYALAYIEENSFGDKARAEVLYRAILARYPGTEWAKQSEKNLGLPSTVKTQSDLAHALFLEAENRRLAGEPPARVIPLYREIVVTHPSTEDAARAQFVVAFLREQIATTPPPSQAAVDSAKVAYEEVRTRFPGTVFAEKAGAKVDAFAAASDEAGGGTGNTPPPEEEEGEGSGATDDENRPTRETLDPKNEEELY